MSLADKIFTCFKGAERFTLKEAYEKYSDKPAETIRARIYDNLGVKFKRIAKGIYCTVESENEKCIVLEGDGRDLSIIEDNSMSDNNSSAFNFRFISHTTKISKHGMGMAVDINTLYNPYVKAVDGELSIEPANAADYVDRSKDFSHKIDHDDLCYKLFTEHGFEWGGDWTHSKDYQHFEK